MSDEDATCASDGAKTPAATCETGNTSSITESVTQNLTPEACRALKEAEERRRALDQNGTRRAPEVGGRNGPEPVRYGDWEKDGLISDF